MKVPDGYLSIEEAAEVAGCSGTTIRNYYRDGLLPYIKIGKQKVAIKREDAEKIATGQLWIEISAKKESAGASS